MSFRKQICKSKNNSIPWNLNRIIARPPKRMKLWKKWFSCKMKIDPSGIFNIQLIRRSNDEMPLTIFVVLDVKQVIGQFMFQIGNENIVFNKFSLSNAEFGEISIEILIKHFIYEYFTLSYAQPFVRNFNNLEKGFDLDFSISPLRDHPFYYFVKTKKELSRNEKFANSTLLTNDMFE